MSASSVFKGLAQEASRWERVLTEGDPATLTALFSGTLTGGATNQALATFSLPSLTRAFYCESIILSSNKQLDLQVQLEQIALSSVGQVIRIVTGQFQPVQIPIRALFRPGMVATAGGSTSIGTTANRNGIDATLTGAIVNGSMIGHSLYDDFDFGATKVGLIIGDSISNGTAGITQKYNSYEWKLRERFRANGSRLRLVTKAVSGTTTTDHERQRAFGMYTLQQVDLIIYMLGMNDALQSIAGSTTQANLAAAITWKQRNYPNALMLVLGTTPAQNNTTESYLAGTTRPALSAAVSAAADNKVKYIDLTNAFDRTLDTTVYASSDTAGSRIHPNDTGHAGVYSAVDTALTSMGITTL
jgi:lysophospholipase L1-like esterase